MRRKHLSLSAARRIALAAQGFARPRREAPAGAAQIRRVIEQLGLLQLDFVNVLLPAHRLIPYSRLGTYQHAAFDRAVYERGNFTEQWAHEASIVPVSSWPLLQYKRDSYEIPKRSPLHQLRKREKYLAETLQQVRQNGALTVNDLPPGLELKRVPGEWHRSIARCALDYHFGRGNLAVRKRLSNFQRVYDLPERLIPDCHRQRVPDIADARRELLAHAAAALGVATTRDLADYYRMTQRDCLPRVLELAEAGTLQEVEVESWDEPAWLHTAARLPRAVNASALLSPFDPVVWYRPRAERLFDFFYRIEIYVPEAQRRWGYYVLPFLCGERIVARVDLKAERERGVLQVRAAHAEEGIERGHVAAKLAAELHSLAHWLELESVQVGRRGNFARQLGQAVRSQG